MTWNEMICCPYNDHKQKVDRDLTPRLGPESGCLEPLLEILLPIHRHFFSLHLQGVWWPHERQLGSHPATLSGAGPDHVRPPDGQREKVHRPGAGQVKGWRGRGTQPQAEKLPRAPWDRPQRFCGSGNRGQHAVEAVRLPGPRSSVPVQQSGLPALVQERGWGHLLAAGGWQSVAGIQGIAGARLPVTDQPADHMQSRPRWRKGLLTRREEPKYYQTAITHLNHLDQPKGTEFKSTLAWLILILRQEFCTKYSDLSKAFVPLDLPVQLRAFFCECLLFPAFEYLFLLVDDLNYGWTN